MARLIDAHIHFWDPDARRHEWLSGVPALNRRFVASDVEFGARIPDGLVFVEADRASDETMSEVDWVSSLAGGEPPVVGIVAHAPLERGAAVDPLLGELARRPLVVGVRRLLQHEPAALLADPALVEGTRRLAARGLTSDLCATMDQLPAVIELVRACPETSFVLDHLGKPDLGAGVLRTWGANLRALASCPNVSCKLSGIAAPGRPQGDLLPYLRHAIDAFGPWRCLFGSDWPVALLSIGYQDWLEAVLAATDGLDPSERDAVMGENAVRIYGLGVPPTTPSERSARRTPEQPGEVRRDDPSETRRADAGS